MDYVRQGGRLGFISDLYDAQGIEVPFFGYPAKSMPIAAMIARRVGARIWIGRCIRIGKRACFDVNVNELRIPRTSNQAEDIRSSPRRSSAISRPGSARRRSSSCGQIGAGLESRRRLPLTASPRFGLIVRRTRGTGSRHVTVRSAKFQIGQVVRHRVYPFRGVIFDVDPTFSNTEEWYRSIPKDVRPHKDQPFYHLLAENADTEYIAYVSEQNLVPDASDEPLRHPQVSELFEDLKRRHLPLPLPAGALSRAAGPIADKRKAAPRDRAAFEIRHSLAAMPYGVAGAGFFCAAVEAFAAGGGGRPPA